MDSWLTGRRGAGIAAQIERLAECGWKPQRRFEVCTHGVSTDWVTANFMFLDRGTCWVLPLIYFYLPRSATAYLLPQSDQIHYFCGGPISVDPICPQPNNNQYTYIMIYTYIYIYIYIYMYRDI